MPPATGVAVCSSCKGRGWYTRGLKADELRADVHLQRFVAAWVFYHRHGTLPNAGALLDQPDTWVGAVTIMEDEVALIHEEARERARRAAERK